MPGSNDLLSDLYFDAVQAHDDQPVTVYVTYTRHNPKTNQYYPGKTRFQSTWGQQPFWAGEAQEAVNTRIDQKDHQAKTALGFGPGILDRYSTNELAIRGREQMLIDHLGGAQKQGGFAANIIRGVRAGPASWAAEIAAYAEFGPLTIGQ